MVDGVCREQCLNEQRLMNTSLTLGILECKTIEYDLLASLQAAQEPDDSGVQIDPDLQATTFYLGLQSGNQSAYEVVEQVFLNVSRVCLLTFSFL